MNLKKLVLACFILVCLGCKTKNATIIDESGEKVSSEISQAYYDQSLAEIISFLNTIDAIIKKADFEAWQKHCSEAYLKHYAHPEVLKELSQRPMLKTQNLKLKTLKDYFLQVFIPSRLELGNLTIDKLEFITPTRVKVLVRINNASYLLYLLEKDDKNNWKISLW